MHSNNKINIGDVAKLIAKFKPKITKVRFTVNDYYPPYYWVTEITNEKQNINEWSKKDWLEWFSKNHIDSLIDITFTFFENNTIHQIRFDLKAIKNLQTFVKFKKN